MMRVNGSLKRAFTLIELLVVIAIIAILAAILFPVFAQAKAAAKTTVSISNSKQQMLGLQMYVADFDDTAFLPWEMGVYPVQLEYPYTKNVNIAWDGASPMPNIATPMTGSYWGDWTLLGTLSWNQQGLEYSGGPRVLANQANPSQHAVLVSLSCPNQPGAFNQIIPGEQGWFTFDGWNQACYEVNGTVLDWEDSPQQGIGRAANLWHSAKYVTGFQDGHAKVVSDEAYQNPTNDCGPQTAAWYYSNIAATGLPQYNNLIPTNAWGAWMVQPKHIQYWGAWWDPSE